MKDKQSRTMPLTLPLRKVGNSLMLTIPKTLAELYDLAENTEFEVIPDKEHLTLKSVKK
jgi:antitoxin component of MazEF toxin-antitoxin module